MVVEEENSHSSSILPVFHQFDQQPGNPRLSFRFYSGRIRPFHSDFSHQLAATVTLTAVASAGSAVAAAVAATGASIAEQHQEEQ